MKRMPLRVRMTIIISIIIMASSIVLTICVMNSGIMKLDSIQADVMNISVEDGADVEFSLSLEDVYPGISDLINQAKNNFLKQSIVLMIIIIVIGAALTWLVVRVGLKPVRNLCEEVEKTTEDNLNSELALPEAKDELRQLAEAFNDLRNRLNESFVNQKQFSANAAHELRTPLAVIQTSLEVFNKSDSKTKEEYQEKIESTLEQIERLNKLVNSLLEFQSMHTAELNGKVIIPEIVEEITCDLASIAEEKNVKIEILPIKEQLMVNGNEVLIYRAIYNLIENAIKYNKENGEVKVSAFAEDAASNILIRVYDTGQGIPKEQWESIFDAFYRVDKSRSRQLGGAGLGLALVREIAKLHNGSVFVEKSGPDGSCICLKLQK